MEATLLFLQVNHEHFGISLGERDLERSRSLGERGRSLLELEGGSAAGFESVGSGSGSMEPKL